MTQSPSQNVEPLNFFHVLRPLLQIGRATGLIPLVGTFGRHSNQLFFRWKSLSHFTSLVMIAISLAAMVVRLNQPAKESTALQRISKVCEFMFHGTFVFIYIQFWMERRTLVNLIHFWNHTIKQLHFNSVSLHSRWVIGFIMVLSITENLLHDFLCASNSNYDLMSLSSKKFLKMKFPYMASLDHPLLVALTCLFVSKFWAYSWNLVDLIVIVMCRTLSDSFRSLKLQIETSTSHRMAEEILGNSLEPYFPPFDRETKIQLNTQDLTPNLMTLVTTDFMKLRHLTQVVSRFLSPLFIPSYSFHLVLISLHVNRWLMGKTDEQFASGGPNPLATLYMWISSSQFILRTILLTYFAAGVHYEVQNLMLAIQNNCPVSGKRLERIISSLPVGIDIFGMIVATRGLFVSILGFIFSFQIVLLQSSN